MIRQIRILTKAQLCNFGGFNVMRYSKDKKKRANTLGMGLAWLLVGAVMCFYMGAIAVGYIKLGIGDVVPMYLATIAALIIFFFGMLKAGNIIFQKGGYEGLCAMPVSDVAVVVSRFLSMYISNLVLAVIVTAPGMVVYGYMLNPGIGFYVRGIIGTLFIPLLPMTLATLFGALVTAISSRMKHKGMVSTVLTIGLIGAIMLLSGELVKMDEAGITEEMLLQMSDVVTGYIGRLYPPAVWLGRAMIKGSLTDALLYMGVSAAVFVLMVWLVAISFKRIYTALYSVNARHDYKLQTLQKSSALSTLYKREWKRYFSCGIYMMNTIIGPIMMVGMAVALFFAGTEQFEAMMEREMIIGLIPFVLSACACMGTTTCSAVSLEGKTWWIVKSMPISVKTLFDSKILMNLSLTGPAYVVAVVVAIFALKPSVTEGIWLAVLPAAFILFASVFGLRANLWFPRFDWEDPVQVVKQGASVLVGTLGGSLIVVVAAVPMFFVPYSMWNVLRGGIVVVLLAATLILYKKNNNTKLTVLG